MRFQMLDQFVKLFDLFLRQGGGRLIHDYDAGVDRQGAGDGHQVLGRDAKIAQLCIWVQRRTDAVQQRAGVLCHTGGVDQAKAAAGRVPDKDVFGHGQLVEQHGFLMDCRNPVARCVMGGGKLHRLAIHEDLPAVRPIDTRQGFHDRGFTCAVFPDQRRNLAGIKRQLHLIQRGDTRERLNNAIEGNNGNIGHNGGFRAKVWAPATSTGTPCD